MILRFALIPSLPVPTVSFLSNKINIILFQFLGKLFIHVSKPPKEGTLSRRFLNALVSSGKQNGVDVEMIHTKINIGTSTRNWQHERFSLKKVNLDERIFILEIRPKWKKNTSKFFHSKIAKYKDN